MFKVLFPNLRSENVMLLDINKDVFDTIKIIVNDQIELARSKKFLQNLYLYNINLAGHLEEEYALPENKYLLDLLERACEKYHSIFKLERELKGPFSGIHSSMTWINVMRKTEYNPIHRHHNAHISWVMWVKIPYDLKNEDSLPNTKKANTKANGRFEFISIDAAGMFTEYINLDKSYEGRLCLFPTSLHHQVYPFYTSDDTRISLAGNITLK